MKCRPLKYRTRGFGAVRLIRAVGLNLLPSPDLGGPSSIFQDDGASTEVIGSLVSSIVLMTAGKGSRTSPEKLNPTIDEYATTAHNKGQGQPTEHGIDDVVGRFDGCWEILGEGQLEVLQLFGQSLNIQSAVVATTDGSRKRYHTDWHRIHETSCDKPYFQLEFYVSRGLVSSQSIRG